MKSKFKLNNNFVSVVKGFIKNLFFGFMVFFYRFKKSISLMSRQEKNLVIIFGIVFLVLLGVKVNRMYLSNTKPVPATGGKYTEAVFGDLKYLNPILVSSDADKSTSKLLFSSLIRADKNNQVISDVASKWEISPDNLKYTFTLRDDVYFTDGRKLTASDVAYTVNEIKDVELKSPLYDKWKDVTVEPTSDSTIVFTLPKAYGAFIYNCDFGILPSYLGMDEISKSFTGSGPYKFVSTEKTTDVVGSHISKLTLEGNSTYFAGAPYINKVELEIFSDKQKAIDAFKNGDVEALSGVSSGDVDDVNNYSFDTAKHLTLIFNLRNEKLKNKDVRDKIVKNNKVEGGISLTLTTLDNELQRQKAEELKRNLIGSEININIRYLNAVDLKSALDKKDFELLLYGFDFGHDRDPYAFWHSSQLNKNNFSGYSDKNSDILLEDARMMADPVARNQKYDQFMQTIQSENMAVFYDPTNYSFYINKGIKGVDESWNNDISSKYFGIEKWYIKEGRVKK